MKDPRNEYNAHKELARVQVAQHNTGTIHTGKKHYRVRPSDGFHVADKVDEFISVALLVVVITCTLGAVAIAAVKLAGV